MRALRRCFSYRAAVSGSGQPADIGKEILIMRSIHELFRSHGLTRSSDGRILGGVCAGLGQRLGLRPWPARLLFLLLLIVLPGCQLLLYPVLWIVMPLSRPEERPTATSTPWTAA
jgi:phage shock protein C